MPTHMLTAYFYNLKATMCYLCLKEGIDSGNFVSEHGAGAMKRKTGLALCLGTGYKTSKALLRLESLRGGQPGGSGEKYPEGDEEVIVEAGSERIQDSSKGKGPFKYRKDTFKFDDHM